jgi:hypothetical protein
MQKQDKKNNTTTQKALDNLTLCVVRAAATIIRRIQFYPGANKNTPIPAIWKYNRIKNITSKHITNTLQDAILAIEEDTLHIAANKIGTHSIHLGAAMAMFLGGCLVFLIMIIGRWSSNAFLRYIWKQVEEFNHDVSPKMLTHMFHRHIPNYISPTISNFNPRQRNHPDNAGIRINVVGGLTSQATCFCQVSLSTTSKGLELPSIHFIISRLLLHTEILGSKKLEEASLLVPAESSRRGFESLLEHDSKAQPPLCICWDFTHS